MAEQQEFTPQQVQRLRCIQASMAIEGFDSSWDSLVRMEQEFQAQSGELTIETLISRAKAEGRSHLEVFREHYSRAKPDQEK